MGFWRIHLFGDLRAVGPDRTVWRFRTQRTAALLAYLAYFRDRTHSREALIDRLWRDADPDSGRHNLRQALSSLRRQLEPPGVEAGAVLVADRQRIGLNAAAVVTDVADFETALRAAEAAEHPAACAEHLEAALELYRRGLLPGFNEEWIPIEQERLAALFFQALRRFGSRLTSPEALERALHYARLAVAADPLREAGHEELMRLYAAAGQPAAALRHYRKLERLLQHDLQCGPAPATRQLAQELALQPNRAGDERPERLPNGVENGSSPAQGAESPLSGAPVADRLTTRSGEASSRPSSVPSGTVTFLFLAGTAPPEPGGPGEGSPCSQGLDASWVLEHGGCEVDLEGVGRALAFEYPSAALACALALRSARHAGAPALPPALVLDTGEVMAEHGACRGSAMERGARVLAAAHPGQLLCTETTAALVRRQAPNSQDPEVRLVDLGLYSLGEAAPARIYQVDGQGTASREFPPLDLPRASQGNLPLRATRFFGRELELAQLLWLFGPDLGIQETAGAAHPRPAAREELSPWESQTPKPRLVTLTGPGGSGKTRLALEAGRRLTDAHGVVCFVPLEDLTEAAGLPEAILEALQVPRSPAVPLLEQVAQAASDGHPLLVLDNFEHLAETGAPLLASILERGPALRCLVTSRCRLNVEGERELTVPPLPVPEADELSERLVLNESVQLFVDRVQSRCPDFQITAHNAAPVAELCRRLEGIPLALELAAARARLATPAQMLVQMERRFDFLVGGRRDAPARHRSLHAALEWSYELLSPELQRLFAQLSVFEGGWTAGAAAVLCSGGERPKDRPGSPLSLLEPLREESLILAEEQGGGIRFRMLETLRAFAREKLAHDEQEALRRRHAEWYLALAEVVQAQRVGAPLPGPLPPGLLPDGAPPEGWIRWRAAEDSNLWAALEWFLREPAAGTEPPSPDRSRGGGGEYQALRLALALRDVWRSAYTTRRREALERALERSPAAPVAMRLTAWLYLGDLAAHQRDVGGAEEFGRKSLEAGRRIESPRAIARALGILAAARMVQRDLPGARALYEEGLALKRASGDTLGAAWSLYYLGVLARRSGHASEARTSFEQCLPDFQRAGDEEGIGSSLYHLAGILADGGDLAAARPLLEESLALLRQLGNRSDAAHALLSLGDLHGREGDFRKAQSCLRESLQLIRQVGDRTSAFDPLCSLGDLALDAGDRGAAGQHYREALGALAACDDGRRWRHLLESLARLASAEEQWERAAQLLAAAEALRPANIAAPTEDEPGDRAARRERPLADARARLGERAFRVAWARGGKMKPEQAAALIYPSAESAG